MPNTKVADAALAGAGKLKVAWAESRMPVLMALREEHAKRHSLKGMRVAGCLHVTKETAVLVRTIIAAGAVVTEGTRVPAGTIYAGVPAKKLKDVSQEQVAVEIEQRAKNYIKYAGWYK